VVAVAVITGVAVVGCEPGGETSVDDSARDVRKQTGTNAPSDEASPTRDPLAEARQQVIDAQADYNRAYLRALAAPGDRRKLDGLLALYTSDTHASVEIRDRMRGLAERGLAGRAGPAGYYVVEQVDVTTLPPKGQAVALVCTYDDAVVFDAVNKGPGGEEIVVNDAVVSARTRFHWSQRNGKWRLEGGEVIKKWEGVNQCPAKSSEQQN
jgi:hypothetical protein